MNDDPLAQLRDIHLPAVGGWWPPAPGWWIVAGLILAALIALGLWLVRRHRRDAWRRQALAELSELERTAEPTTQWCVALNQLLKRVAARCHNEQGVARMTGEQWSNFLASTLPNNTSSDTSKGLFSALANAAYKPEPNVRPAEVIPLARTWIRGQKC